MRTPEAGICHAWRCPHCDRVQLWEIGLADERRQWWAHCPDCAEAVELRYDPRRDVVTGYPA